MISAITLEVSGLSTSTKIKFSLSSSKENVDLTISILVDCVSFVELKKSNFLVDSSSSTI